MPKTVTISARIDKKLDAKLARIAKSMRRSKSWTLIDALDGYLADRQGYIDAVEQGRRDFADGRDFSHDAIEAHFRAKPRTGRQRGRAA